MRSSWFDKRKIRCKNVLLFKNTMDKLKILADDSVDRALNRMAKCPTTDITKADALMAQGKHLARTAATSGRIQMQEVDRFKVAFRQAVLDRVDPAITLEAGSGRFDISVLEKNIQSKVPLKPRDQFTIESDPDFNDVYARAADLFNLFKLNDQLMTQEEFMNQVAMLYEALRQDHPQFFDSETGEPLTPILPFIKVPTDTQTTSKLKRTYIEKLERMTSYLACNDGLPKMPFRIKDEPAKRALAENNVHLYLPKLYHGYSLDGAINHYKEIVEDGFELCDPLTGITVIIQNLHRFIDKSGLLYKLAFHHFTKGKEHFALQISDADLKLEIICSEKAKTNVTSGLLYGPQ